MVMTYCFGFRTSASAYGMAVADRWATAHLGHMGGLRHAQCHNKVPFSPSSFCWIKPLLTGFPPFPPPFLQSYTAAFLGSSNAAYCAWIVNPMNWGGGIELSILVKHYRREIAAWNIESARAHVFGEDAGANLGNLSHQCYHITCTHLMHA